MSYHSKSNEDSSSNVESEEYKTILYTVVNEDLTSIVSGVKFPIDIKQQIQKSIQDKPEVDKIKCSGTMVDVLNEVSPEVMRQAQEEDLDFNKAMPYVNSGKKLSLGQIRKIK